MPCTPPSSSRCTLCQLRLPARPPACPLCDSHVPAQRRWQGSSSSGAPCVWCVRGTCVCRELLLEWCQWAEELLVACGGDDATRAVGGWRRYLGGRDGGQLDQSETVAAGALGCFLTLSPGPAQPCSCRPAPPQMKRSEGCVGCLATSGYAVVLCAGVVQHQELGGDERRSLPLRAGGRCARRRWPFAARLSPRPHPPLLLTGTSACDPTLPLAAAAGRRVPENAGDPPGRPGPRAGPRVCLQRVGRLRRRARRCAGSGHRPLPPPPTAPPPAAHRVCPSACTWRCCCCRRCRCPADATGTAAHTSAPPLCRRPRPCSAPRRPAERACRAHGFHHCDWRCAGSVWGDVPAHRFEV